MTDQTIPEEAVEAAAKAEYFNDLTLGGAMSCTGNEWDKTGEQVRRRYIAQAERQLTAAYPHLRQQIGFDLRGWFVQQETRELIWTSQIDLADEPVMPLDKWLRLQRTDSSKET